MANNIRTTVSELPDARVQIEVEVPAGELEAQIDKQARVLAGKVKIAGFRRGKVPPKIVLQRLGRDSVAEEAVSAAIGRWYSTAIEQAGIVSIGNPRISLGELPPAGSAYNFSVQVGVLPQAKLGEYKSLEVGVREPQATDEQIEHELGHLRERFARLEDVQRPAQAGDFVVVDMQASLAGKPLPAGQARDELVELGAGRLAGALEERLIGAAAGEDRSEDVTFPQDHPEKRLRGRVVNFQAHVKQVKSKKLPELDEDFAADAGFDSMEDLRSQIRERLLTADSERLAGELRQAALDAAVQHAEVAIPAEHAKGRAQEIWERNIRRMSAQGIPFDVYLQAIGKSEDELLAELQPMAEQSLRREAVLTAIVRAEGIMPDDEELLREITRSTAGQEQLPEPPAEPAGQSGGAQPEQGAGEPAPQADEPETGAVGDQAGEPGLPAASDGETAIDSEQAEELFERLRASGRLDELREDLAGRRALDLLAEQAKQIPIEQAQARAKLWTPDEQSASSAAGAGQTSGERPGAGPTKLWTPGA